MRVWLVAAAAGVLAGCAGRIETVESLPTTNAEAGRIVVFRDAGSRTLGLLPAVTLNEQELGDAGLGSVYIRDVPAGEYEIALQPRGVSGVHIAAGARGRFRETLLRGEEHYFEVDFDRTNCRPRGPLYLYTTPAGAIAGALAYALMSAATKDDGMDCEQVPVMRRVDATAARDRIAAIAANPGGRDQPAFIIDADLPADSSTPLPTGPAEKLALRHFEANRLAYASYIETTQPANLQARKAVLLSQAPGPEPDTWHVLVRLDGDRTMAASSLTSASFGFNRMFYYLVRRGEDRISVVTWSVAQSSGGVPAFVAGYAAPAQQRPAPRPSRPPVLTWPLVEAALRSDFDAARAEYARETGIADPTKLQLDRIALIEDRGDAGNRRITVAWHGTMQGKTESLPVTTAYELRFRNTELLGRKSAPERLSAAVVNATETATPVEDTAAGPKEVTKAAQVVKSSAIAPQPVATISPPAPQGLAALPATLTRTAAVSETPQSQFERAVREHFERNRDAYASYIETNASASLQPRRITVMNHAPGAKDGSWDLLVRIDGDRTVSVTQAAISSFAFSRTFRYVVERRGDAVAITDWSTVNQ